MQIGIGIGISFGKRIKKMLARDSFSRADNLTTLGNAESGQAWTPTDSTVWGIESNTAKLVSGAGRVVVNSVSDNYAVQAKLSTMAAGTNIHRVVFRYIDSSNELFFGKANATQYQLSKRVAGASTSLGLITQTPVSGDVIRVEVRGNRITAKVNGITIIDVTDSANSTGTKIGLYVGDTTARFDDFIVEAL
jgi:hypothetical protein